MALMKKRRNFASFDSNEAFKKLNVQDLIRWEINFQPLHPSAFFQERLRRLEEHFDLTISERAKELLIDAICEEVVEYHGRLKIWKAAMLQSEDLTGIVDYLVAPRRAYLEAPLLCVVEAKKDDFEKGLAQCLVEMKACQWNNEQLSRHIDVFGIVTNGEVWKFYKLTGEGAVFETLPYSLGDTNSTLGILYYVFTKCEEQL